MYNKHVELIKKLRETGDFQRLWSAREAMQQLFPLSEGEYCIMCCCNIKSQFHLLGNVDRVSSCIK